MAIEDWGCYLLFSLDTMLLPYMYGILFIISYLYLFLREGKHIKKHMPITKILVRSLNTFWLNND